MLKENIDYIWTYLKRITSLSSEELVEQLAIILLIPMEEKVNFLNKQKNYFEFETAFLKFTESIEKKYLFNFLKFNFKIPTPDILKEILITVVELEESSDSLEIFEEVYLKYLEEKNLRRHVTPNHIADLMISLAGEVKNKVILDCFCGTGNILYKILSEKENHSYLQGIDINEGAIKILFFRTLFKEYNNISLLKNDFFSSKEVMSFNTSNRTSTFTGIIDLIFAHPPFGSKVTYNEKEMRIEKALLYKTIDSLKNKGKAIIIIPYEYLRMKDFEDINIELEKNKMIEELIVLPTRTFEETLIKTAILVLNKAEKNEKIKFWTLEREDIESAKKGNIELTRKYLKSNGEGSLLEFLTNDIFRREEKNENLFPQKNEDSLELQLLEAKILLTKYMENIKQYIKGSQKIRKRFQENPNILDEVEQGLKKLQDNLKEIQQYQEMSNETKLKKENKKAK